MFTISRSAAALVALALTATIAPANAGMYTSSCVGGWRYGSCVETFVAEPRHPNLRYVPWAWGDEMSDAEHKAMAARDRKWVAFCKPVIVKDRFNVSRYLYTRPGCEFGRSE
jgi:hypothetical protein